MTRLTLKPKIKCRIRFRNEPIGLRTTKWQGRCPSDNCVIMIELPIKLLMRALLWQLSQRYQIRNGNKRPAPTSSKKSGLKEALPTIATQTPHPSSITAYPKPLAPALFTLGALSIPRKSKIGSNTWIKRDRFRIRVCRRSGPKKTTIRGHWKIFWDTHIQINKMLFRRRTFQGSSYIWVQGSRIKM